MLFCMCSYRINDLMRFDKSWFQEAIKKKIALTSISLESSGSVLIIPYCLRGPRLDVIKIFYLASPRYF